MIIDCNTFSCPTSMVVVVMMAAVDDRPGRWLLRGNNRYCPKIFIDQDLRPAWPVGELKFLHLKFSP